MIVRELHLKKIAIIGSPGAGKTTLAKKLGPMLKIKVIHLDRLFWRRDWQALSREERIDSLEKIVREKEWIIEGTYLDLSEPRLEVADVIIYLDIHSATCLSRLIKRHHEEYGQFRRDIPLECTDKLTLFRMWKVLTFPFRERRWLEKKIREFSPEKIIRLDSTKEVKAFLAQPERYIHEKRQSAKTSSVLKQETQYFSLYRKAQEADSSSMLPVPDAQPRCSA